MKKILLVTLLYGFFGLYAAPSAQQTNKNTPTPAVSAQPNNAQKSTPTAEVKKDDLTKKNANLQSATFGGSPIFKYKVKDSNIWNALITDVSNYVAKNGSDDKVLKANLAIISNEANAILNTTKIIFNVIYSTRQTVTDSDKKLFDPYTTSVTNLEKAKKALTSETYVFPGKRDSRSVLVDYAILLIQIAQTAASDAKKLSFATTPTPKPATPKKITIYNNTKNKVVLKLKTADGNKEISIDAEKSSSDIQVGLNTSTSFVQEFTVQPLANINLGSSGSVTAKPLSANFITVINNALKSADSSKFTILTDGKTYTLESGIKTGNAKEFAEAASAKHLVLRNKTQNKLRVNIVNSVGKEIVISMSCSTSDTALHVIELPADKNKEYIRALYISSIPIGADALKNLNSMIASKKEPLFDIRLNEDKSKVLWQYFINQAPD